MRKTRTQWLAGVLPYRAARRAGGAGREKKVSAPPAEWLCRLPWGWAPMVVRAATKSEARALAKRLVPGGRLPVGTTLERKG